MRCSTLTEACAGFEPSGRRPPPSRVGGVAMREEIEQRLRGVARRAGFGGAPPAVVATALVLLGLAVVVGVWRWWPRGDGGAPTITRATRADSATTPASADSGRSRPASAETSRTAGVFVHVVGEVRRPGVYELPAGSRIEAAVDAAGGPTSDADTAAVNLAAKAADGQQISVPAKGDRPGVSGPSSSVAKAASSGAGSKAPTGPVNINTADEVQLDSLPGVGPSTAAKILADRQSNGPFESADDLGRVPGIGPKKLDQLKPMITVQ